MRDGWKTVFGGCALLMILILSGCLTNEGKYVHGKDTMHIFGDDGQYSIVRAGDGRTKMLDNQGNKGNKDQTERFIDTHVQKYREIGQKGYVIGDTFTLIDVTTGTYEQHDQIAEFADPDDREQFLLLKRDAP